MAPEIVQFKKFDGQKADIFALGVILFVTVMGVFPFEAAKKNDKYYSLFINPEEKE